MVALVHPDFEEWRKVMNKLSIKCVSLELKYKPLLLTTVGMYFSSLAVDSNEAINVFCWASFILFAHFLWASNSTGCTWLKIVNSRLYN